MNLQTKIEISMLFAQWWPLNSKGQLSRSKDYNEWEHERPHIVSTIKLDHFLVRILRQINDDDDDDDDDDYDKYDGGTAPDTAWARTCLFQVETGRWNVQCPCPVQYDVGTFLLVLSTPVIVMSFLTHCEYFASVLQTSPADNKRRQKRLLSNWGEPDATWSLVFFSSDKPIQVIIAPAGNARKRRPRITWISSLMLGEYTANSRQKSSWLWKGPMIRWYIAHLWRRYSIVYSPFIPFGHYVRWNLCYSAAFYLDTSYATSNHVLHPLVQPPSTASQTYNLRKRTHSLQLPDHTTQMSDKNFITHMLYKNAY